MTIVALAIEAGVPRNALSQGHTDLKAEFYRRVGEGGAGSKDEERLRATIRKLRKSGADTGKDLARARADIKALLILVNGLVSRRPQSRRATQ
jgi:hypothetical protein